MKHLVFTGFVVLELLLLATLFLVGDWIATGRGVNEGRRELVARLMLTDFAVWTEAHYTRNPSQTDFFTPFQDFPAALEHFPSGSIIAPDSITIPGTTAKQAGSAR